MRKLTKQSSDDPLIGLLNKAMKNPATPRLQDVAAAIGHVYTNLHDFYTGRRKTMAVIQQINLCLLCEMSAEDTLMFVRSYAEYKPTYHRLKKSDLIEQKGMTEEEADKYMKEHYKPKKKKPVKPAPAQGALFSKAKAKGKKS